jgi:hypothetical protein
MMLFLISLNANLVYRNVYIVLTIPLAAHALATQRGITVVLRLNATALMDLIVIYQRNLIV